MSRTESDKMPHDKSKRLDKSEEPYFGCYITTNGRNIRLPLDLLVEVMEALFGRYGSKIALFIYDRYSGNNTASEICANSELNKCLLDDRSIGCDIHCNNSSYPHLDKALEYIYSILPRFSGYKRFFQNEWKVYKNTQRASRVSPSEREDDFAKYMLERLLIIKMHSGNWRQHTRTFFLTCPSCREELSRIIFDGKRVIPLCSKEIPDLRVKSIYRRDFESGIITQWPSLDI
jgi:hypothetical protein